MTKKTNTCLGIFQPLKIKDVEFEHRILRSSVGGRHCTYDGTVTDVWKNFEKRFADGGVAGIISTTFHVNRRRLSPMQYPSIAECKFKSNLARYIGEIKKKHPNLKYIVQIGDPGYVTYESLFRDEMDALSSSAGFDLPYGYQPWRKEMTGEQIQQAIEDHAEAAQRVKDVGADGVEIAAAKGYLIHQFLNPAINRREDKWGGDAEGRFRLLKDIVTAVHCTVGRDPKFLIGVRLAAADHYLSPPAFAALRWPSPLLELKERRHGNDEAQMLAYAKKIQRKIDYLHIISGFGFPSPRETPGKFPYDEVKQFFHATHTLTGKTRARSGLLTLFPKSVLRWFLSRGWTDVEAINEDVSRRFKENLKDLAIIVNGGFSKRATIDRALRSDAADMVSMARALLANPNFVNQLRAGRTVEKPCSRCNKCVGRTGTSPLGCYDTTRFANTDDMYREILRWNEPDRFDEAARKSRDIEDGDRLETPPLRLESIAGLSQISSSPSPAP